MSTVILVARTRIELVINAYQASVIPFNYPAIGGNGKSRTFTGHRMKVLHYRYATLPYRNTPSSQTPTFHGRTNLVGTDVFLYGRTYRIRTDHQ